VGKTKRGKGTKIMAVADRNGLPVSVCAESATPHEGTLAMSTLIQIVVPDVPENLIGDNAYDFDRRSYRFSRRLSWVGFLSIPTMWTDEFNAVESHLCILLMLRHPSRRDGQTVI
jgi:hypothetical protein